MLDRPLEYLSHLVEIVAGVQHQVDPQSIAAPSLDLVEVPPVA
jgi:hypothetical protein